MSVEPGGNVDPSVQLVLQPSKNTRMNQHTWTRRLLLLLLFLTPFIHQWQLSPHGCLFCHSSVTTAHLTDRRGSRRQRPNTGAALRLENDSYLKRNARKEKTSGLHAFPPPHPPSILFSGGQTPPDDLWPFTKLTKTIAIQPQVTLKEFSSGAINKKLLNLQPFEDGRGQCVYGSIYKCLSYRVTSLLLKYKTIPIIMLQIKA